MEGWQFKMPLRHSAHRRVLQLDTHLAGCQTRIAEYRPERSSSKLLFAAWSNSSPDFLLDLAKMARNIPARSMFERVAEAMKIKDFSSALANGSALSSVVEHYLHTVGVVGSKPTARTIFKGVFPNIINFRALRTLN